MWSRALTAAVLLLSGVAAQASVVYQWQPLHNSDAIQIRGGELIITDAAARSGNVHAAYDVDYAAVDNDFSFPDSPIEKVSLQVTAKPGNYAHNIAVYPRSGYQGTPPNPLSYDLQAELQTAGEGLTGDLDLLTLENSFDISASDSGLWTLDEFSSDALQNETNCGSADLGACPEVSGRWARRNSDVPAPSAWLLFGLCLAGICGARRYRRAYGAQ